MAGSATASSEIGAWLFRRRGWLPVPWLLAAALTPPRWPLAGAVVMLTGEALRLWAVGYIGRPSRTRGAEVGPLVEAGPYAMTRNPLYLGNLLLYGGFGLVHWPWALLLLPLGAAYYDRIVRWEETNLLAQRGAAYAAYLVRVPRWWPRGRPGPGAWRAVEALRSERTTLALLAIVLTLTAVRWYRPG